MVILHIVWMFLKLVRENGVISPSSYLNVLKIRIEMRGNDLNKQIYSYLKINLQQTSKEKAKEKKKGKKMTHQLNQSPHLILVLIIPSKINPTVINFFLKKKTNILTKKSKKVKQNAFSQQNKNKIK